MKKEKETPLYFNASVLIGDILYFTAANSVWLYALHMEDGRIEPIIKLPCHTKEGYAKFSSLIYYSGKIWMVPWDEPDFLIYDMERNAVMRLPLPKPLSVKEGNRGIVFRKAVKQDNILWLLPSFDKFIVKIDMEGLSCELFRKWAKDLAFDEDTALNFKCIYGEGKSLYLFADGCKSNLVFDTENCEVRTWGRESCHAFGAVKDKTIYLSPVKPSDYLESFSVLQGEKETVLKTDHTGLHSKVWEKTDEYAYWYSEAIDGKIYFLPHTAKALLILNVLSGEIQTVPVNEKGYETLREYKGFAGYEAVSYEGGVVITPHSGNKVLMEKDGKIVKEYLLKMPDIEQSKDMEVQCLIDQFVEREIIDWSKITIDVEYQTEKNSMGRPGMIGALIYNTLTSENV